MKIRSVMLLLGMTFILVCEGCGDGRRYIRTEFVEGTVKVDGQPVKEANVVFMMNDGSNRSGAGYTDENGKFTLTADRGKDGAGVPVGDYLVTITKVERDGPEPPSSDSPEYEEYRKKNFNADGSEKNVKLKYVVPKKYGTLAGGLTAKVQKEADAKNVFDFDLSSK